MSFYPCLYLYPVVRKSFKRFLRSDGTPKGMLDTFKAPFQCVMSMFYIITLQSHPTMIYLSTIRAWIWWWRDGDTYIHTYTLSVCLDECLRTERNQECVFLPESKVNTDHWSRWWSPTLVHQSHASEGYLGSECMIIWLWPHFTWVVPVSWNFFFFPPRAVLNPHQAINPPPGHSTSLSLYFSTFLHGEAWLIWLSMMEDRKVEGWRKVFRSFSQMVTQTNGSTRWLEFFGFFYH